MPEFSEAQLKEIAENTSIGLKCYVHRETGETISFPDPSQSYDATGEFFFEEEHRKVEENFTDYIEIAPMPSSEMYRVMAGFTETITDARTRQRLERVLEGKKPMRNFNYHVHESGPWREEWFKYRDQQLVLFVKEQIEQELHNTDEEEE